MISLPASDTDIKIDSLHGYLYFSSGHAVEYCRLNGKNKGEYYRTEVYAGKQVMGLTLDIDNQRLFWIVRGYDGSSLFMAKMPGSSDHSVQEFILKEKSLQGPLTYFSDRLCWLQDEHTVIISNITGKNLAHIRNQKLRGLKSFAIIDQTHHVYPNLRDKLNVTPEPVNVSEMTIDGSSKCFNLTWPPIRSVNYGEVFYEISFLNNVVTETTDNSILYANDTLDPYTPLDISIRAYTYWAASKISKIMLFSPAAEPSTPTNPRVFVTHRHDPLGSGLNIEATFRWNAPKYPNGPISGYVIEYWYDDYNHSYIDIDDPNVFERVIPHLMGNVTYFFEVRANSKVGMGAKTSPLAIHTKSEKPIPTILASIDEGIWKIDMDLQTKESVVHTGNVVRLLTSIQQERKLYWIDDNNNLMSYDDSIKTKLATLSTEPLALTVDWIERVLYWSQPMDNGSAVFALDLNSVDMKPSDPKFIMDRTGVVNSLSVSPKDRLLFWVETTAHDQNNGILMTKSLDDDAVKTFFPDASRSVYKTFSLDTSSDNSLSIIWRGDSTQLFTTDINREHSSPIDIFYDENQQNLVKDSGRLYWTKNDKIHAYSVYANDHHEYVMNAPNANRLFAFFHQNYLDEDCMIPLQGYNGSKYIPELIKGDERSLHILLPESQVDSNCNGRKPPAVLYTILYAKAGNGNVRNCTLPDCKIVESLNDREIISNLKPFVRYKFQIGVNNYYGRRMGIPSTYGPVVVFKTSIGFPSAPRNVHAEVISPTEAIVQWQPPIEFNGDAVWFEVHWETQNVLNRGKNRQQEIASDQERILASSDDSPITMNITKLIPSQPYKIWVRAYTSNSTYNDSEPVQIETISEPENISLTDRSPYNLRLHWTVHKNISKYIIEYQEIGSNVTMRIYENLLWHNNSAINYNNSDIVIDVDNLKPKTQYKFSILLYFLKRDVAYTWPSDSHFVFETLGDRPTSPGIPLVIHVSGEVFKVSWQPSGENGATILEYSLEAQQLRVSNRVSRSTDDIEISDSHTTDVTSFIAKPLEVEEPPMPDTDWKVYYNGTDSYWIIQDLHPIDYAFRCRSRNSYGWSPYSATSEAITGPYVSAERQTYIMIAICVPIALATLIILTLIVVMAFRQKNLKKNLHGHSPRIPDVELANLRELPRGANLIHSHNILYTQGPLTDTDIALLPQIRRDQMTMTIFLGSGAFGEVYEGIVKNAHVDDAESRVAIKTLRKGATAQEKSEFLQEAHLMSNFKHDHILRLIGVCFDNETLFIIMELMQGGDLLSFLRQSRPSAVSYAVVRRHFSIRTNLQRYHLFRRAFHHR